MSLKILGFKMLLFEQLDLSHFKTQPNLFENYSNLRIQI